MPLRNGTTPRQSVVNRLSIIVQSTTFQTNRWNVYMDSRRWVLVLPDPKSFVSSFSFFFKLEIFALTGFFFQTRNSFKRINYFCVARQLDFFIYWILSRLLSVLPASIVTPTRYTATTPGAKLYLPEVYHIYKQAHQTYKSREVKQPFPICFVRATCLAN